MNSRGLFFNSLVLPRIPRKFLRFLLLLFSIPCASPKLCPSMISTGCDVAFHNRDAISPSHDGHDWTLGGLDPSTSSLPSHASTGKLGSSPAARGIETKTSKA